MWWELGWTPADPPWPWVQEEAGLEDGWMNATVCLLYTAKAEASVCCALTLQHSVFLFSQTTGVCSIFYPESARVRASKATSLHAGEAVTENGSMDNLARFQQHRVHFKHPVNRPVCFSFLSELRTQHKNMRGEFSTSPHLRLKWWNH